MKKRFIILKLAKIALFMFFIPLLIGQTAYTTSPITLKQQKENLIAALSEKYPRNQNIIYAISAVERLDFLPESLKEFANIDIAIPLDNGGLILSYSDIAKALSSIDNNSREKALIIGKNTPFPAAVLSSLYDRVFAIESSTNSKEREKQEKVLNEKFPNVTIAFTKNINYFRENAPFDLIFVNSALKTYSGQYLEYLSIDGQLLLALEGKDGFQVLYKVEKTGESYSLEAVGNVLFP